MPSFEIEDSLPGVVVGIDEAGRGPLCGPVYAACVVLSRTSYPEGLDDSKMIPEKKRESIFERIMEFEDKNLLYYGVGAIDSLEIDRINILNATKMAMAKAYRNLVDRYGISVDVAIVDGNFVPEINVSALAVIKGDRMSYSIACASIIAKVLRDRELRSIDSVYPQYHWAKNKGYGTAEHIEAIVKYGLVENYHRKSFCGKFMAENR
ncbi:MAG: ribonuclease HII [Rickettsiales bacterium]|jgi:ribonuclease HII|nr:ribonuclease HII [Rickettsiales bacterium]